MAHRWACILLLDEADVFLAKRTKSDVKRNELVSVFLRILEYHPGILFLTINRVGAIDDAFRSRLHLTLYYPKLVEKQSTKIWKNNIRKLEQVNELRVKKGQQPIKYDKDGIVKWAKTNWESLQWNGRQIRNAFQTAIPLAEFKAQSKDRARRAGKESSSPTPRSPKRPVLSQDAFMLIAEASTQFNDYLLQTHGQDEDTTASRDQIRPATFKENKTRIKRVQESSDSDTDSDSSLSSGPHSHSSVSDSETDLDATEGSDISGSGSDKAERRKRQTEGCRKKADNTVKKDTPSLGKGRHGKKKKRRNDLSWGQTSTHIPDANAPKARSMSTRVSFSGISRDISWNDNSEFREGRRDSNSDLLSKTGRHVAPELGFNGEDHQGIPLPRTIGEQESELIDRSLSTKAESSNPNASAEWAPIKGLGLPSDVPRSVTEPSEVTDFGHQMYSDLRNQGRVTSFPVDDDDFENTLADRIFEASRENLRDRRDFLPQSQLDRLIHKGSVASELRISLPSLTEDQIDTYANLVCHGTTQVPGENTPENLINSYQKVFAILALINKVDCIEKFLDENVCDADLPLQKHIKTSGTRRRFSLRRKKDPRHQLRCFRSWDQITLRNFEQYQWAMIPPFFTKGERKNVKHYVLDPSTVLPFTFTKDTNNKSKAKVHRGGYSLVYQADIHPDHHDFNNSMNSEANTLESCLNTFAIKRLDSPSKEAFQEEVQILKRFSGDAHPHLISLLATYERSDTFYLIFPWAGADLMTYWKSENPTPKFDAATVIWMAEQCQGLASGLAQLHKYETGFQEKRSEPLKRDHMAPNILLNGGKEDGRHGPLYGRHGDIKPENILWFPNHRRPGHKGTLKISDFGLSELNSRYSKSKRLSQVPNSPTYRPPECDLRQKIIKQSYDIWTLGCLYLEFIAWILGGLDLVEEFARRRRPADAGQEHSDCFFEIRDSRSTGGKKMTEVLLPPLGGTPSPLEDSQSPLEDSEDSENSFEGSEDSFDEPEGSMPSLGNQFLEHLEQSQFDTKGEFLPEGCLDDLINREALRDDLFSEKGALDLEDEKVIDFINTRAKKVFATTYCVLGRGGSELVTTMKYFLSVGFSDKVLPIEDLRSHRKRSKALVALQKTWVPMRIRNFYQAQWMFLAPVFSRDHFHHVLSANIVLPFVWVNKVTKEGRFSKVYEVKIHENHQKLLDAKDDGTPPHVAIKEILTTENDKDLKQEIETNFNLEASALSDISTLEHEHIIERIAAITIDARHYFMFQWADGGNLREFWKQNPQPKLTPELIQQSLYQLRGLADALVALHHFKDEANYRHGDLKPENVLRFKDKTFVGHFKIADMGLAKRHTEATDARGGPTSTKFGTTRYEPPETVTNPLNARSRLYDVWSLGCIILEYIIWLLYGYDKLQEFSNNIQSDTGCFYLTESGGDRPGVKIAKVHPTVVSWMEYVGNDPECSTRTAMRDLLALVRDKLLVVALQADKDTKLAFDTNYVSVTDTDASEPLPVSSYRARATAVNSILQEIWERGKSDDSYLLASKTRPVFQHLSMTEISRDGSLGVPGLHHRSESGPHDNNPDINSLNPTWHFYTDNTFADNIIQYCDQFELGLTAARFTQLCSRCKGLDILSPGFKMADTTFNLLQKAKACGLCKLVSNACQKAKVPGYLRIHKIGSTLKTDDVATPLLSIIRSPVKVGVSTNQGDLQVGHPILSPSRHEIHFEILRKWIQDCDNDPTHRHCRPDENPNLPTRLLDVEDNKIRLVESKGLRDRYLALSHPWGDPEKHSHFCTYTHNIANHMAGINWGQLPGTFKDAITTTRELGVRYLWIDSLCIIQGPDGDFTEQSKHMEQVFSSAYCVLAASRATGQSDGFLGDRVGRDYLTLSRSDGETYHICEEIDDFQGDVIDGALNQRGWVLQERALARRTVYFTEKQTYWECGEGIRCETFTKMKNNIAAFLGDPRFPKIAMDSTRAEKIYLYQMFYEQYSKLEFSKIGDRPFAIAGLEKRLIRGFGAQGGYGIIDDGKGLLHRSLLWRRPSEGTLHRIEFPPERNIFVPTWSWMAYEGGIGYLSPTLDGNEWEQNDIRPPWSEDSPAHYTTDKNSKISLDVTAKEFDTSKSFKGEVTLHFDIPDEGGCQTPGLKCVVLARPKTDSETTDRRWYVLLVAPQTAKRSAGLPVFERIGVGRMPESCISQSLKIDVKLQ
ncbi:tol-like protein [Colletotrichum camelliae]|nr:tol-like protein [Colletotrichum camelliae]